MAAERLPLYRRFHIRLTLLFAVPVFAILTAIGIIDYRRSVAAEVSALQARLRATAVSLSQSIDPRVFAALRQEGDGEKPEYKDLVKRFAAIGKEEPTIQSIYAVQKTDRQGWLTFSADWVRSGKEAAKVGQLYDATQTRELIAAFLEPRIEHEIYADEWGRTMSGYAPIFDPATGVAAGVVGVDVSAKRIDEIKRRVLGTTALLYGLAALLLGVVGAIVGRNVRGPLASLVDATEAIAAGRLDARTGLARKDELGILARHFDAMAIGLEERERIRAVFGRYVSEEVARKVLASPEAAGLGGEEREVTVVFSDIRNYSTIAEYLSPTQVVELLNRYIGAMGDLIDQHRGCIIEFLGDGILAVFGAPEVLPDHAARAVACARAMDARLTELNEEWEKEGIAKLWQGRGVPKLAARIGIHTGHVVAGNMGGARRVKYAVVGDTVNVASRVENLNNALGTTILATGEVIARLPADAPPAEAKGDHQLKGRDQPIKVYSLSGNRTPAE
jgi:adenylate cyclase